MKENEKTYFCIDMKSFYASVECAERRLDPMTTHLVVADPSRGKNALCLAVSPSLKAKGVRNRCRLSEIPKNLDYLIAPPRMRLYVDYAAAIYGVYLRYFDPRDLHVYSIDESFLDVTSYLTLYRTDRLSLAKKLMREIEETTGIPSTAGIGTNLYLAKIALDITAKHAPDRIGVLDEATYRATLWEHTPITDFWQISTGTASRLLSHGITTMRGIAQAPEEMLYRIFGVNAELLIDHAFGRESCRMEDIKNYRAQSHSLSFSQILPRDYSFEEARTVLSEMLLHGAQEMLKRRLVSPKIGIMLGCSGEMELSAKGSERLGSATNLPSRVCPCGLRLFDRIAPRDRKIRRLAVTFENLGDEAREEFDLFTDTAAVERERAKERAVLSLAGKYGKNAVLRGTDLLECATQRERNEMIGGHRAGYDDTRTTGEAIRPL